MSQRTPSETISQASAPDGADFVKPLALGTLVLDRYTVLALLSSEPHANIYRVAEGQSCLVCHVENDGGAESCGFCGTPLPPALTRCMVEQRAPENGVAFPSASYLLDGKLYSFVRDTDQLMKASPMMRLTFGYCTDPGVQRGAMGDPNQDALGILHLTAQNAEGAPSIGLAIVADGIGGAQAGQEASRLAVQTITRELNTELVIPLWNQTELSDDEIRLALTQAIANANSALIDWANRNSWQSGTTLTLALIVNQRIFVANLGDSRTYLVRNGKPEQITRDHSYIAQLIANGTITAEDAYNHPQRNLILKSLGDPTGYDIDLFPSEGAAYELSAGDQLLLCSDGLWEMVREPDMAQVLTEVNDPQAASMEFAALANSAGGMDNITVVIVRVDSL